MFRFAPDLAGLCFTIAGEDAVALACGGLWLPASRTLVVSDLHLEKGSSYAARGQLLPPWDTAATLDRVADAMDRLTPDVVAALGDSFHDMGAGARIAPQDRERLMALTARARWIWIEGNHDPAPPGWASGLRAAAWRIGPLLLRHEPTDGPAPGEIAGHLHPSAVVVGRAGRRVRRRCFATDGQRLVMPAYGAFTGGLDLLDAAFAPLFGPDATAMMLGRDRVYAVPSERLTPVRARATTPRVVPRPVDPL
jgi:DNA ligase-associated metallophosphoesterase